MKQTKLSININKIATLRNSRGGNVPNVMKFAADCEALGADGITVHPRPDERHIRFQDVKDLQNVVKTEFNIEGYPSKEFIRLVTSVRPKQVTLVPDGPEDITSHQGWDTKAHFNFLCDVVEEFKSYGIRTSIFMGTELELIEQVVKTGTDRIELYTEPYAAFYPKNREEAIAPYVEAAAFAKRCGLGLNAGHDLNLENLAYFRNHIPTLDEVSIGHALVADALYLGIEETIKRYKNCLTGKCNTE